MRRIAIVPLIALVLGVTASPVQADGPPEVGTFQNVFPAVNPCTGDVVTVTSTGEFRLHFFQNAPGDMHHSNEFARYDIESSDGFRGSGTFRFVHNGEGLPRPALDEQWGQAMLFDVGTLRNPDTRQTVVFKLGAHATWRDGEFIVAMEWDDAECRGRPA